MLSVNRVRVILSVLTLVPIVATSVHAIPPNIGLCAYWYSQANAYLCSKGVGVCRETSKINAECRDGSSAASLGYIDAGDWWQWDNVSFAAGAYQLVARIATWQNNRGYTVNVTGSGDIWTLNVPTSTGGYNNFSVFYGPIYKVTVAQAGAKSVRCTATNGDQNEDWLQFIGVNSDPPGAPSNVQAAALTSTSVRVRWNAATDDIGVAGYIIYRNGSKVGTSATTSYNDTGLTECAAYSYSVAAYDTDNNESAKSYPVMGIADVTAPSPGIVSSPGYASTSPIVVSYSGASDNCPDGLKKVELWFKKGDAGTWAYGLTEGGASSFFSFTGMSGEGAYYFALVAEDKAGNRSAAASGAGHAVTIYDTTPPSTPVVTDDGEYTASTSEIHATWTSDDPVSGVAEHQYAISSTPDESGIVPGGEWQSTGTATEATRTGLALTRSLTYYVLVKARNGAELWSSVGVSDGITVIGEPIKPLGLPNLWLGGGDFIDSETGWGQKGVKYGTGRNTIGLLVRIWGAYSYLDAATFTVDDGSGAPIMCVVHAGVTLNPSWRYVLVTGISGCYKDGEDVLPRIRVRDQDDIVVID